MKTNTSINGELVKKELDLIDTSITRLDTQIQTSKNICIGLWTAWLGWFLTAILEKQLHSEQY